MLSKTKTLYKEGSNSQKNVGQQRDTFRLLKAFYGMLQHLNVHLVQVQHIFGLYAYKAFEC